MTRGKFITFEGGEGVGKSTNVVFVENYLRSKHIPVVVTREPGGTPLAEKLRTFLLDKNNEAMTQEAELLLMFAARAQHLKQVIEPALARGEWVICDRFTDATYAYQGGGRRMKMSIIESLENLVQGTLRPDLTLLLDAPVKVGMARAGKRGAFDRFESETVQFFDDVRRAYLLQAERNPKRITLIKASQPLAEVQQAIVHALSLLVR